MTVQERLAPGKYKLTVEDYLRLDETGIFGTSRTELLDGDIIVMNAEYRPHAWVRDELWFRLRSALERLGSDYTAMSASVRTSEHDMPLPDIVLTNEPIGEGPIPITSTALIVEVSSTTLHRDTTDKLPLYARAGVPEYWIADVAGRVVHQHWQPSAGVYVQQRQIRFGTAIKAATLDGLDIETDRL